MAIKRNQADHWFSKCVRASYGYKCCKCGKQYDKSSKGFHCSHIFSRRHKQIRYDKLNAVAMCYSCHNWYSGEPVESGRWAEDFLGAAAVEILEDKLKLPNSILKKEELEIARHYKAEFEKIELNIDCGIASVDFVSYQ